MMRLILFLKLMLAGFLLSPLLLHAQTTTDTVGRALSLQECIEYALSNTAVARQAALDEEIGERDIKAQLSAWLPQVSAQYNYSHSFKLQTTAFGSNVITIGRKNNSNLLLQANQVLYSNELFLASRAAHYTREGLNQNTENVKINTTVAVSKAFYDILLTVEQLKILDENIRRQEKQYRDALSRFETGIVDKTDYQRASITLANSRSDKKRATEALKAKHAYLKQLMGYPPEQELKVTFDIGSMEQQIKIDTLQPVDYASRVEYRQLQVRKQVVLLNTAYYRYGFLPTVTAFANYNNLYFNNQLGELYRKVYPTSAAGLSVSVPIFRGTARLQNLSKAKLQEKRVDADIENARNIINTEYQTTLANYKSSYNEWITLKQNVQLAKEVYEVIKLQYDEGIKAYVDLIVAETDLKATEVNYYNALYRLLSSKLDLQRALGKIE